MIRWLQPTAALLIDFGIYKSPCQQLLVLDHSLVHIKVHLDARTMDKERSAGDKQEGNHPIDLQRQGLWEIGMWLMLYDIKQPWKSFDLRFEISNLDYPGIRASSEWLEYWQLWMIFPVNGYPLIQMSQTSYSKGTVGFKMSHIEAKSINIWLRYDPKCNLTICGITFWVISQPNVDGFWFNMAHFEAYSTLRI